MSKAEVREAMVRLELIDAKHAAEPGGGVGHLDDAFLRSLYAQPGPSIALDELDALWLAWEGPANRQLPKAAGKGGKAAKQPRAPPKTKDRHPSLDGADGPSDGASAPKASTPSLVVERALQRALDRRFPEAAHGARLLYLVELYEGALSERDAKHAEEVRRARDAATTQGSTAAEAEAERSREWERERASVAAAHAAVVHEMTEQLKAEKAAHHDELTETRASAEQAQAAAIQGERLKVDELRAQLKRKTDDCEELSEQLSVTRAELQATKADREDQSFLVKKTRHEQEAEHDAYEVKLQKATAALKKAEAAQPTQGGYYFAAARASPVRPASAVVSPPSKHGSPEGLFDKTRRLSADRSIVSEKAARASEMSPSPPETERSDMKSSKGSRQGRGKSSKNKPTK